MISEGLILMCAGMVVVYSFLFILIMVCKLSSHFILAYEAKHPQAQPATIADNTVDDQNAKIACVLAIVHNKFNIPLHK